MTGFIYAIRSGDYVKIGYSANPCNRLRYLRTGTPHECVLVGARRGTQDDEKAVHRSLAAYSHRREWYRLEGAVPDFVATLAALNEPDVGDMRRGKRTPEQIANWRAKRSISKARRDEAYERFWRGLWCPKALAKLEGRA